MGKTTLSGLARELAKHEQSDTNRHREMQGAITAMATNMGKFTETVQGLVEYRTSQDASDKTTRRIFYGCIAVAGVLVPLFIVFLEHTLK